MNEEQSSLIARGVQLILDAALSDPIRIITLVEKMGDPELSRLEKGALIGEIYCIQRGDYSTLHDVLTRKREAGQWDELDQGSWDWLEAQIKAAQS